MRILAVDPDVKRGAVTRAMLGAVLSIAITACTRAPATVTASPLAIADAPRSGPRSTFDARAVADAFDAMGDALCHDAGSIEWDGVEVRLGLARAAFFEVRSPRLRAEASPLLSTMAKRLNAIGGVRVRIDVTLEDEAFDATLPSTPQPRLVDLATARVATIVDALVANGVARDRLETSITVTPWEGSYDGPAAIDPCEGRVELVALDPAGAPLRRARPPR